MRVSLTFFFSDFSRISKSQLDFESWALGSSETVKLVYRDGFFNLESSMDFYELLEDENEGDFDGDVEEIEDNYDFPPLCFLKLYISFNSLLSLSCNSSTRFNSTSCCFLVAFLK